MTKSVKGFSFVLCKLPWVTRDQTFASSRTNAGNNKSLIFIKKYVIRFTVIDLWLDPSARTVNIQADASHATSFRRRCLRTRLAYSETYGWLVRIFQDSSPCRGITWSLLRQIFTLARRHLKNVSYEPTVGTIRNGKGKNTRPLEYRLSCGRTTSLAENAKEIEQKDDAMFRNLMLLELFKEFIFQLIYPSNFCTFYTCIDPRNCHFCE